MVKKVIVFLIINTLQLINSISIKKKKLAGGWLSSQGLYSITTSGPLNIGNPSGYSCNQGLCGGMNARNSNRYVNTYGAGLFSGSNLVQTSPYIAYLPGSSGMNSYVDPDSYSSGESNGCNYNIANSNANACNPSNQTGNANAISDAYAFGTNNYIFE